MEKYIRDFKPQKLTEEKNTMEKLISKVEIENVIDQAKIGKAPGPDGFPVKFYKIFKSDIIYWLQLVGNEVLKRGDIPPTWQKATIAMIPKQEDFRPIYLLNVNYKIFTKVIAEYL